MTSSNNLTTIKNELWYIPMDIVRIICTIITIVIACILLVIIASNRTLRTVPMMLTTNTCLAELICACTALSFAVYTLENDLKSIEYEDSLCVFRAYLNYGMTVIQNLSYVLQAFYRYVTVVYPSRVFWQSKRFQMWLISMTWMFGLVIFLPLLLAGQIIYKVDNQICQSPIRLSFSIIYIALIIYMIPNMIINLIYFKLVRYVRQMSKRVTPANSLFRAERELKMVRNILAITTILVILGLPYAIFIFMSFFTNIPKYHFRIAFIFVDISTTAVIIAVFKTTDPIKTVVIQKIVELTTAITRLNA